VVLAFGVALNAKLKIDQADHIEREGQLAV